MIRYISSGILFVLIIAGLAAGFTSCKKDDTSTTSPAPGTTTNSASWVGRKWAVLKGQVNGKNQLTTVTFQYDTTTSYTHSVSPDPDTTTQGKNISFTYTLINLKPKTKYHYRINAINPSGTGNGADVVFTTGDTVNLGVNFNPDLTYDSIYDVEGNKYRTIQIGTQTWMAENLRSTKLNDDTEIPFVLDVNKWSDLTTPGYCWFNSDSVSWGALYNWYTVNTGLLCPQGWHVPGDEEWTVLTDYLGGKNDAGGKLKETGTGKWYTPNTGATNESGFTAIPTGYRHSNGGFNSLSRYAYFWTSTEWSETGAWYRDVYFGYISVDRSNSNKRSGLTVRCIKD
jgi:uncharacterized protein (TIGR02145 family)